MKRTQGWLKKRGKVWYACWEMQGRSTAISTGTGDKKKAAAILDELVAPYLSGNVAATYEALAGRAVGRRAEAERLADEANPPLDLGAAWMAYKNSSKRPDMGEGTLKNYESIWKMFAAWIAAANPDVTVLRDVVATHVEGYGAHLVSRGVSGRTVNGHRQTLRAIWNVLAEPARLAKTYTLRDGRVSLNPWSTLPKRAELTQGRRPLTVDELRLICGRAEGELRTLLALGVYTACRLGDAAMMEWGHIDLTRGFVTFTPRKTAAKTGKAIRVPIHDALRAILVETPMRSRRGPVCPEIHHLYETRGSDPVAERVTRHIASCGLTTRGERKGAGVRQRTLLGFHSLRHTAISLLRESGAAQSTSMELVGHHSEDVHQLYTHADEPAMRRAIETLPNVIAIPVAGCGHATALVAAQDSMLAVPREALRRIVAALDAGDTAGARAGLLALE